jgi:periplasmic protein TonB
MGYQALLFCADEKTAGLVTQVLSELEFSVERSIEPFEAVKRLTTQHFDAIVVDCDNEQNAGLLFKSARNSGPNRTSLAVAVVEGQAGIAKAFRIGANLVLTKPINVEQSKGTLRVARGLLKKPDTSKPAAASSPFEPPAAPTAPASSSGSVNSLRPLTPVPPAARAVSPPPVAASVPSTVLEVEEALSAQPEAADAALLESLPDPAPPKPVARPAASKPAPWPPAKDNRPVVASPTGAAAAAPARRVAPPEFEKVETKRPMSSAPVQEPPAARPKPAPRPAPARASEPHIPAPTFGISPTATESGSRKWVIILLVLALAGAGGYIGWTKFHHGANPAPAQPAQPLPDAATPQPEMQKTQPAPVAAAPVPAPVGPVTSEAPEEQAPEPAPTPTPKVATTKTHTPAPALKPAHEAIVVKSSASSAQPSEPVAPPVIAMSTEGGNKELAQLVSAGPAVAKPVLRTLKVSQGVSQGMVIKKVQPDFPAQARQLRIEGAVQLLATVGKDGNVSDLKVLGGHPVLARAATDAVKKWKYKPYLLNGQPIEFETQITVNFRLP